MVPCLILGDSHALATAAEVRKVVGERCGYVTQQGLSSAAVLKRTPVIEYASAVISAGANDADNPDLVDNLNAIRGRLNARRVVWLLPYNRDAAASISWVAQRWGDRVIDLSWARARRDGVHCMSYSWVARSIVRGGYLTPTATPRTSPPR